MELERMLELTLELTGQNKKEVKGKKYTAELVYPRHLYYYAATTVNSKYKLYFMQKEISKVVNRAGTHICANNSKIRFNMKYDKKLSKDVDKLMNMIYSEIEEKGSATLRPVVN